MSVALQNYLQANKVTLGMEEFTDGETALDVHVSPEPSVDHVVAEVVEADFAQREIARDGDQLNEATAAMESYATFLDHSIENGGVTQQTVVALAMGMERYNDMIDADSELMPSMEEMGGTGSIKEGAKAWAAKIWEWLKKAYEVSSRILAQMVNKLKDLWSKSTFAAERMAKRAGELKQRADALGNATLSGDKKTLTVSSASKLMVGDKFEGTNAITTTTLIGRLGTTIPMGLATWIDAVASKTKGFKPGNNFNTSDLGMPSTLNSVFGNKADSDQRFGKGVDVRRTDAMPGNKAMYIAFPEAGDGEGVNLSGHRIEILAIPGAKNTDSHELTVATPKELAQMAQGLGRAAGLLKEGANKSTAFSTALESLDKSIAALVEQLKNKELSKDDRDELKKVLGVANSAKSVASGVGGGFSYCVSLIGAQLSLVERQLAQYGKPAKKDDE